MRPDLLPFCILQTPLGKPKKQGLFSSLADLLVSAHLLPNIHKVSTYMLCHIGSPRCILGHAPTVPLLRHPPTTDLSAGLPHVVMTSVPCTALRPEDMTAEREVRLQNQAPPFTRRQDSKT